MFCYKCLYVIPLHFVAQPIICGEGDCQQGNGNDGGYRRERQRYCTTGHLGYVVVVVVFVGYFLGYFLYNYTTTQTPKISRCREPSSSRQKAWTHTGRSEEGTLYGSLHRLRNQVIWAHSQAPIIGYGFFSEKGYPKKLDLITLPTT